MGGDWGFPSPLDGTTLSVYARHMLSRLSSRRRWALALPVIVLLAVSLPHLDQGDFRTDTGRYAAVGLQAWRDPACFWTPHLQPSIPYFNKPPLVFWIHGFVLHAAGVTLTAARLPSVAAAALCVLLTTLVSWRLMGHATALTSGLVLALTYEFFRRTREISLDLWQLAFMLGCVALVVEGVRRRRFAWFILAGIPLGLALLCKPLMAFVALPLLAVWLATSGRSRRGLALIGTLATAIAVAAPWHASMVLQHGMAFTSRYFGSEIADRALGRLHAEPLWYYVAEIGATYWPWMLALGLTAVIMRTRPSSAAHRSGVRLALIWTVGWFVVLSLFPDKRPRYELPLYPALAMLAGHGLARLPWRRARRWYRCALPRAGVVVAVMAVAAALLPLRLQAPPDRNWAMLLNQLRAWHGARVFSAALSTNDEGYHYLAVGRWPEAARRSDGALRSDIPRGSILVYTDGLTPRPGPGEAVVFSAGPYRATRLDADEWRPAP